MKMLYFITTSLWKIRDINDDNGLLDTYYNLSEYYKKKIDIAKSINGKRLAYSLRLMLTIDWKYLSY
jgi:hypothetical protein